ncbi:hypothetical protein bplSymb_SCF12002P001 [Bathymodiolus platifrons methanotrophic gill symbiont]|uniref:protelomerase family protein n=1 Tax=unclassified Gammaproteobacteria TaxID=33811 RepID=UPI000B719150|nr:MULTISPECIES: protelomerase family protein [unclassified Gammaproteobacteria]GAW87630.1 hypothetical protein bplSymb_SCF12002P001 [Bathymodiolus platifrons methanotrophic gill symbiont]GFO73104.1 hypothetical protein BJAS_P3710 [Bathymodiolus japonicus methanotrophic gill symbiont]GFO75547.1 hypothetical protein BPLS_P2846 [Bathymodiolus platifrons methanotrophic gill symbiont]
MSLYNDLCNLRIELKPYYGLTPVNTIADSTRKSSQKNLNLKHSNVRLVSRQRINSIFETLATSDNWINLSIYIALASGRRCIEVLSTGDFAPAKGCNRTAHIEFSGQAKTKGRDNVGALNIPILVPLKDFNKIWKKLREILSRSIFLGKPVPNLTHDEINTSLSKALNNRVKALLGKPFTFKDLRAIYATSASQTFHDPNKRTIESFFCEILGHAEDDLSTQLSYKGISIVDELDDDALLDAVEHLSTERVRHKGAISVNIEKLKLKDAPVKRTNSVAIIRAHEFTKDTITKNPSAQITQTLLTKLKAK